MVFRTYYAIRPTDALLETVSRMGINGYGIEKALFCKTHHDRLPRSPDVDLDAVRARFLEAFRDSVSTHGLSAVEFSPSTFDKYWVVDVYSDLEDVDDFQ